MTVLYYNPIEDNASRSSEEIKDLLFSSVAKFIKGKSLEDDLSLVVVKYN